MRFKGQEVNWVSTGRVCVSLTVSEQVVLHAAQRLLFCLATAEPRPLVPELGVELRQDHLVIFDLWMTTNTQTRTNNIKMLS